MKIILQKWGAKWCGPCVALARRGTLEKFAEAHPDVKVEVHDDTEEGGSKAWEKKADALNIKNLPSLVWFANHEELLRSDETSMAALEKQYAKVIKMLEVGW